MSDLDFIEAYDNVLSKDFCEKLIKKFETSSKKTLGQTGFGVNKIAKDSIDITLNQHKEWEDYLNQIEAITRKHLVKYMRKYYHLMTGAVSLYIPNPQGGTIQVTKEVMDIINDDLFEGLMNKIYRFGTLNMQKYDKGKGGYHHWHSETYPKKNDKSESLHRVLLYMYYLNDVKEGGETEFFYQNKKLNPTQGQLVIAPSGFTHTHKGCVPISDDKYILTSWILFRREEEIYGV
ncbi:MAG: 2OG-Fe(II) oxygenase [Candidatus Sericytochromatia bacterium]